MHVLTLYELFSYDNNFFMRIYDISRLSSDESCFQKSSLCLQCFYMHFCSTFALTVLHMSSCLLWKVSLFLS